MSAIGSFRDLDVWVESMDLVDEVFRRSRALPPREFDLRRQLNRAAISIPSNIAEGWCRKHRRQAYQNHVSIAMGSRGELETELEICYRNGLLERDDCAEISRLLARVAQMLNRLHDSLET